MNISEANHVNQLLDYILGYKAVTEVAARESAQFLTARAYRALGAGLMPDQIAELWQLRPSTHTPRRGDTVDTWLTENCALYDEDDPGWYALTALIDDYHTHADHAVPLDQVLPEDAGGGEPR